MIDVKNLIKKFGEFTAVNDVTFHVKPGEIFAFLGPNGAGKTTTIKMLTTLLEPTTGTIRLNGFDPVTQQDDVRTSFGIVFQDSSLDDELTAYENLSFHTAVYAVDKKIRQHRIVQMLKLVDLYDRKNHLVKTFSGGMKRRLEIARALTHHPKILFLDEPTLGLDPQTRNHMWEYVEKLCKSEGMTVFFTTHYMEEAARVANRIAIIDQGKIISCDSAKNLMKATKTKSLEDAFLKLTGNEMREEKATAADRMRQASRVWKR